jgi:hypothetical protein
VKIFILFKQIAKEGINEKIHLTPHYDERLRTLVTTEVLEASVTKECINVFCDVLEAKQAVYNDMAVSHFLEEDLKNKWLHFLKNHKKNIIHYIYDKQAIHYEIIEKEIINNKIINEATEK